VRKDENRAKKQETKPAPIIGEPRFEKQELRNESQNEKPVVSLGEPKYEKLEKKDGKRIRG
jgi:hypothetical protein